MKYDKRKELITKYGDVLDTVGKAYPQGEDQHQADLEVALIIMENALRDNVQAVEGVPDDFDWKTFATDVKA